MKSKGVAYFLWFLSFFGWFGFHRFYLHKFATGLLWFFTGGLFGIGCLFDLFTLGGKVDLYNMNIKFNAINEYEAKNDEFFKEKPNIARGIIISIILVTIIVLLIILHK